MLYYYEAQRGEAGRQNKQTHHMSSAPWTEKARNTRCRRIFGGEYAQSPY